MARPINTAFLGGVKYKSVPMASLDLHKLDRILLKRKSYKIITAHFMQLVSRGVAVEEPHPRLRDIYRTPPFEVSVENYEIHDRIELDYDTPTDEEKRLIGWLTRWDVVNEWRKPKKILTDKAVSRIVQEAEACTK